MSTRRASLPGATVSRWRVPSALSQVPTRGWLERMIIRRVLMGRLAATLHKTAEDVKVDVDLAT